MFQRIIRVYSFTMGVTNATETFQRLMNTIFEGILHKIVETYLNDIVIYSSTLREHVEHVREVVNRLIRYVLKIRLAKCKIAQQQIEYLSHIVYHGCIKPNPKKVRDLLKYEPPFNKKQTQAFLGKSSYYKRFVMNFASIVTPLNDFIKESKTKWSNDMTNVVKLIQDKLTSEPILILPQMDQPFQVDRRFRVWSWSGINSNEVRLLETSSIF